VAATSPEVTAVLRPFAGNSGRFRSTTKECEGLRALASFAPVSRKIIAVQSQLPLRFAGQNRALDISARIQNPDSRQYGSTRSFDLISDALPFGRLWYGGPNAAINAVDYGKFRSRSHDAVIRVYDDAGNVIETHEHKGDFKEW
jgi:hypothetical protein